jgi:hypothetical protein
VCSFDAVAASPHSASTQLPRSWLAPSRCCGRPFLPVPVSSQRLPEHGLAVLYSSKESHAWKSNTRHPLRSPSTPPPRLNPTRLSSAFHKLSHYVIQDACYRGPAFCFFRPPINKDSSRHDERIGHNLPKNSTWVRYIYSSIQFPGPALFSCILASKHELHLKIPSHVFFADLNRKHPSPTTLFRRRLFLTTSVSVIRTPFFCFMKNYYKQHYHFASRKHWIHMSCR